MKDERFSDIFRLYRKTPVVWHGLKWNTSLVFSKEFSKFSFQLPLRTQLDGYYWPEKHESEAYSQPAQTFNFGFFAKIVNCWRLLTILSKGSILEIWQGSKYASAISGWFKGISALTDTFKNQSTEWPNPLSFSKKKL